jgi:Flp pilus assembly protein TadB
MARIILFIIAAVVALVLVWVVFWHLLHLLFLGFWVVVVVLLGLGLFRIGRWSSRRSRED